ncbi:MAG: DUF1269 domain-containing protein [Acidimicrobiia bacterium]|nr:DUF1269 domain-containing protein [Acidimicrobiia bacterium]
MNELVVVAFDDELEADEGLLTARRLESCGELTMRDAAIAIKTRRGQLRVRQTTEISTSRRPPADGWWGLLITLLVGGPMAASRYGNAFNDLYGRLDELGLDPEFTSELSESLEPGQSAVFILVDGAELGAVLRPLCELGGRILSTSLPDDAVETIRQRLRSPA